MAKKELSIILRAVNEAGATLNAVRGQLGAMGGAAEKADKQSTGLFSRMFQWATSVKGVVGGLAVYFSARGIVSGLRATANEIDLIAKQSKRLGLTTEYLSELKYAADLSGIEFNTLSEGISNAVKNVSQFVRTGGGRAADAVRALGVETRDTNGQLIGTEDLIDRLIVSLGQVKNAGQQVELTKRIFGDDKFLQVIKEGGERLAIMREEARRLGVSIGPELASRVEAMNDAMTRVGAAWTGIKAKVLNQIAPFLKDLLNRLAGVIAAIPQIVGKLVEVIRKAFTAGEAGNEIRQELSLLAQDVAVFLRVATIGVVRVMYVAAKEALGVVWRLLQADVIIGLTRMIATAAFEVARTVPGIMEMVAKETGSTVLLGLAKTADVGLAQQQRSVDEFIVAMGKTLSTVKNFNDAMEPEAAITGSWQEIVNVFGEVSDAALPMFNRLDRLLGVTSAIGTTDITGLVKQFENTKSAIAGNVGEVTLLDHVWSGMRQQFAEIPEEMQRAIDLGRDLTQSLTTGLSQGVGTALTDVISGAKSFEEAMRNVLSSTARNVSQLIFQFLALKAIMGIASAFTGGSGSAETAAGFKDFYAGRVSPIPVRRGGGVVGVGWGARAPMRSIPGFAGGGLVRGPSVNFDAVLAALTPGERVIREPVSRRHADRLDHLNNTGEWVGGGGTSINMGGIHVTVNGGGGDVDAIARSVERAAADGVLKALMTRGGYRGAFKGALA